MPKQKGNSSQKISSDKKIKDKKVKNPNIHKNNAWKIAAVIVIVIFIVIVISALIRNINYRSMIVKPTQAQIDMAQQVATDDLTQRGENLTDYNIRVSGGIRPVPAGNPANNVIEVSAYNDYMMHLYLIDANSGAILMHSKSESYGLVNFSKDRPPGAGPERGNWMDRPLSIINRNPGQ